MNTQTEALSKRIIAILQKHFSLSVTAGCTYLAARDELLQACKEAGMVFEIMRNKDYRNFKGFHNAEVIPIDLEEAQQ